METGSPASPTLEAKALSEASFYREDKLLLDTMDHLNAALAALRLVLSEPADSHALRETAAKGVNVIADQLPGVLSRHTAQEKKIIDHQRSIYSMRADMHESEERVHMELASAKMELAEAQSEVVSLRGELSTVRRELEDPRAQEQRVILQACQRSVEAQRRLDAAAAIRQALTAKLAERQAQLASEKAKVARLQQRFKDLEGDW